MSSSNKDNETVAEVGERMRKVDPTAFVVWWNQVAAAHNRELAAKDDERLTIVANYETIIADKDAEIAELKDCILKEIDWLKRMIRDDLEGWATSMWSPSDEFRKHTFSRLIEDNTYHIERMKKALKGSNNATK